jgi:HK97 family phage major capsid protein
MNLRELQEQRTAIVGQMRAMTEKPEGQTGDLSDPQEKRFGELKSELAGVERQIERQTFLDEADRRAAGQSIAGTGDSRFDDEIRHFSLSKAIAAAAGMRVDNGRELEISAELERRSGRKPQGFFVPYNVFERRTVTTTTPVAGPGSNVIGMDYKGEMYVDMLRAALVVRGLGATVMTGLSGNVVIPGAKSGTSVGWTGENQDLPDTEAAWRQIELTPRHAGAVAEYSRQMIQQSSPSVEELLRADMAKSLAEAIDAVAIKGGGTAEPSGIMLKAATTAFAMGAPTWEKVLAFMGLVEDANATGSAFLGSPAVFRKFQATLKDATAPEAGYLMADRAALAGIPVARSTLCPAGTLIYGAFSDLVMGFWDELDVLVNPFAESAYKKGNVMIRVMGTCDLAVRHAESFVVTQDIA